LKETADTGHIDATKASVVWTDAPRNNWRTEESSIKAEESRQWQWAVAEEMLPASKDARASQILEEVGRMEVMMDSVADRVKVVKEKLDGMEDEGGVILNLKDNSS
jgi:archaellum component FlaC